jgi:hypothetical protein
MTADHGPADNPELVHDTAAFRARLKACSRSATIYNIDNDNAARGPAVPDVRGREHPLLRFTLVPRAQSFS